MEQFEQLLTCCVCLDRYRIPKLLPCQHSFCMEPCMEGLVDYVRRQVKCPECRAEHRIPYNGVQAFPTNVTLQRFLELHIEITGELPDPTSGQIMERCGVCSEKAYCSHCAHCEKKVCEECKGAHMDILRREISRFNQQIRRSLHRLQDSLASIEKNTVSLQTNCISVTDEIDEIYRRITKAIKDRSDTLKGEIERYLTIELRNLTTLKENLDLEINNISSNCDIVDKYMNETVEWDDCELMDTKEIFLKTVEFLRHFEYENADYSRRVRFLVSIDPNQLVMNLATFGDLNITPHSTSGNTMSSSHLAPPSALQPGLMRSKSDHRLATQFRQQEERGYNNEPVLDGRKFGERPVRSNTDRYAETGSSRYGRNEYDYDNDYDNEQSTRSAKSRFRSRFVRSHQNEDSDNEQQQMQRQEMEKRKDRVLDGEDVSRGQLSGIIRLSDCSRVVQRLADIGKVKKEKKPDTAAQAAIQAAIQAQKASMQRPKPGAQAAQTPPAAQRQISEDDEISRAKRQNKNAPAATTSAAQQSSATTAEPERPAADRVAALKRGGGGGGGSNQTASDDSDSSNHATSVRRTPTRTVEVSVNETNEGDVVLNEEEEEDEECSEEDDDEENGNGDDENGCDELEVEGEDEEGEEEEGEVEEDDDDEDEEEEEDEEDNKKDEEAEKQENEKEEVESAAVETRESRVAVVDNGDAEEYDEEEVEEEEGEEEEEEEEVEEDEEEEEEEQEEEEQEEVEEAEIEDEKVEDSENENRDSENYVKNEGIEESPQGEEEGKSKIFEIIEQISSKVKEVEGSDLKGNVIDSRSLEEDGKENEVEEDAMVEDEEAEEVEEQETDEEEKNEEVEEEEIEEEEIEEEEIEEEEVEEEVTEETLTESSTDAED